MKLDYAKDNMERMPYEFYLEKYQQADPISISNRLGVPYDCARQEFTIPAFFLTMGIFVHIVNFRQGICTISSFREDVCSDFAGNMGIV